jgi:hypothetical protein
MHKYDKSGQKNDCYGYKALIFYGFQLITDILQMGLPDAKTGKF